MRMKKTSFISLALLTGFATFKSLEHLGSKNLQKNLNAKAIEIARNYPEIKYSDVVFTKSDEVAKRTLPLY
jgi:hypothetical protein